MPQKNKDDKEEEKMIKEKIRKTALKLSVLPVTAMAIAQSEIQSWALSSPTGTSDGNTIMSNLIKQLCTLAGYVGMVLAAIGIILMFMGFKNEDAEGKHRAGLVIVAGIGLLSMGAIMNAIIGIGS